jgi:hypothetical protein
MVLVDSGQLDLRLFIDSKPVTNSVGQVSLYRVLSKVQWRI